MKKPTLSLIKGQETASRVDSWANVTRGWQFTKVFEKRPRQREVFSSNTIRLSGLANGATCYDMAIAIVNSFQLQVGVRPGHMLTVVCQHNCTVKQLLHKSHAAIVMKLWGGINDSSLGTRPRFAQK